MTSAWAGDRRQGGHRVGGWQVRLGRGGGQPAAREGKAAAPLLAVPASGEGEGKAGSPQAEEPPNKEGACSAKGAAEREGEPWRPTGGLWEEAARRLNVGERPTFERAGHKLEEREPGHRGGKRRSR